MSSIYNVKDWYWVIAGSTTQVFSSAVGDYVSVNDATYLAWVSLGNRAVPVPTEPELGAILAAATVRPSHPGVLDAYKDGQAGRLTVEINFKIETNQENRIRAIERSLGLNGSPADVPQTAQGLRTWLKGVL